MPKLSKELQKAILDLPETEKDKLLLRLVSKDAGLVEKLTYELLEQGETLEERRQEIKGWIEEIATGHHYSPGWLMMDMRSLHARLTEHVKLTKDQMGEVELLLLLLNRVYDEQLPHLKTLTARSNTLAEYVAKRTQALLEKLQKLHPDYHVEFEEDLNRLLERVHRTAPASFANELGLLQRWPV